MLLALINCKKLDIEKRLELYNKISLIYINLGNILLKLSKYDDNSLNKDSVTFSSIYEIIQIKIFNLVIILLIKI